MADLHPAAAELIESSALAHLATINPDGSPQLTAIWVGLEDGEIVSGHMRDVRKLRNIRRDPRVSLAIEAPTDNPIGLREYLVVHGTGRVTEGGAADLLQRLAHVYIGPDVVFPAMPDPPPGYTIRMSVEKVSGLGDWD
jgi:PPOX class probable F420-dependent enzyme